MDGFIIESVSLLTFLEYDAIPKYKNLNPEEIVLAFPSIWLSLSDDWEGIYQHSLDTPEGWYDDILFSRIALIDFNQSLCYHTQKVKDLILSRNDMIIHDDYPKLSTIWELFYTNASSVEILENVSKFENDLIAESEALLQQLLATRSKLNQQLEGFESRDWDDYQAAMETARDEGISMFSFYENHLMLASVLLIQLMPTSPIIKEVSLSWPPYLLYPNTGELFLKRVLLNYYFEFDGLYFLLDNFERIIPEHLLFLLAQPYSTAADCITVKQAFLDKYQPQGFYPGANNSLENYTKYFDLIISRH
jgi:hypothetical protein